MKDTLSLRRLAPVRAWLWIVAALIFMMVVVGGATRLTDSGLSITEWQPILGAIPPLSDADWQAAFAKYRTTAEYHQVNRGMALAEFQAIYWWEWAHRLLGRVIGLAFAVPLAVFWWQGRLTPALKWRLPVLLALGGAQGALGWWMVMSGLSERTDVSQYRLAAHLGLATALLAATVWTALRLGAPGIGRLPGARGAGALVVLIFVQVVIGGFVAGLDAGLAYNSWPLMDGRFIPAEAGRLPIVRDVFENIATVQFAHRVMAYGVAAAVLLHSARVWRLPAARLTATTLGLGVAAQVMLGVATLLAGVPIGLGLAHQAGAMALLAVALWHVHVLRPVASERLPERKYFASSRPGRAAHQGRAA